MKASIILMTMAGCLPMLSVSAQTCRTGNENPAIVATTPSVEFVTTEGDEVWHKPTDLIWQRCALGQTWDGKGCSGAPMLMNWEVALQEARMNAQGGHNDWRLPDRNELDSLVESRCFLPASNEEVFPGTPLSGMWTSSPMTNTGDSAWIVNFDAGTLEPAATSDLLAVRLVRNRQ